MDHLGVISDVEDNDPFKDPWKKTIMKPFSLGLLVRYEVRSIPRKFLELSRVLFD